MGALLASLRALETPLESAIQVLMYNTQCSHSAGGTKDAGRNNIQEYADNCGVESIMQLQALCFHHGTKLQLVEYSTFQKWTNTFIAMYLIPSAF